MSFLTTLDLTKSQVLQKWLSEDKEWNEKFRSVLRRAMSEHGWDRSVLRNAKMDQK